MFTIDQHNLTILMNLAVEYTMLYYSENTYKIWIIYQIIYLAFNRISRNDDSYVWTYE